MLFFTEYDLLQSNTRIVRRDAAVQTDEDILNGGQVVCSSTVASVRVKN